MRRSPVGCSCDRTAPIVYAQASVVRMVSRVESKRVRQLGLVSALLMFWTACVCSSVQWNFASLRARLCNGRAR